jgi:hypothetical protein
LECSASAALWSGTIRACRCTLWADLSRRSAGRHRSRARRGAGPHCFSGAAPNREHHVPTTDCHKPADGGLNLQSPGAHKARPRLCGNVRAPSNGGSKRRASRRAHGHRGMPSSSSRKKLRACGESTRQYSRDSAFSHGLDPKRSFTSVCNRASQFPWISYGHARPLGVGPGDRVRGPLG